MKSSSPHYYQPEKSTRTGFLEPEICIYGATAAGVIAALEAARQQKSVVILEPGGHLGGMTSAGLSYTDSGQKEIVSGLAREFYQKCGNHYGVEEEWRFEPHVAKKVFSEWLKEAGIEVHYYQYLEKVVKKGCLIHEIILESGLRVRAKIFMDTSYEGDLMAAAGVEYTFGREGNETYGETYNGAKLAINHQFNLPVDPYLTPGDRSSGLLPGISDAPFTEGTGDRRIQAYNFRLCLTQDSASRIPFEKPEGYDPAEYELLGRYFAAGWEDSLKKFDPIRGGKVDMNNYGAVSTNFIGRNYEWPEASYAAREIIFQDHVRYQKGLMWFRANDARVPESTRNKIQCWGLAGDEFQETGGWPPQLYVREGRRMRGEVVMTEHHCFRREVIEDSVGMASYTMDSHNCRRIIHKGRVLNEGNVEVRVKPFPISWRSILPKKGQADNLLVPVCLSSSHIAHGSIRMEPVFMILGQSAAAAAALALNRGCTLQEIPYAALREALLIAGQVLEWKSP